MPFEAVSPFRCFWWRDAPLTRSGTLQKDGIYRFHFGIYILRQDLAFKHSEKNVHTRGTFNCFRSGCIRCATFDELVVFSSKNVPKRFYESSFLVTNTFEDIEEYTVFGEGIVNVSP